MTILVNSKSKATILKCIKEVDKESSWSFSAEDGNELLGPDNDNWAEYSKWHLAVDTEADEETKERYKYPVGKKGKIYRSGVIAAKARASAEGVENIVKAADSILKAIDKEDKDMSQVVMKVYRSEIRAVDAEKHTVEAVVSDETIDRYNEVILASAWEKGLKPYKKHPVLLSSHNYHNLTSQIGKAEKVWVEDGKLMAKFHYFVGEGNEQADWGFKLAEKGLAAFSVGFIGKEFITDPEEIDGILDGKQKPRGVYTMAELLEISQVLVPANPSALAKGFFLEEDPIVKSLFEETIKVFDDITEEDEDEDEEMEIEVETEDKSAEEFEAKMASFISDITSQVSELKSKVDALEIKIQEKQNQMAVKDTHLDSIMAELDKFEKLLTKTSV